MRSKAGRGGRRLPDRRRSGNAKGTLERITFEQQRCAARTGGCISYRLLCNRRNASRDRVIDKFEMPLPVTTDKRFEAALREKGVGFASNTPRVILSRAGRRRIPGSPSLRTVAANVIVNAAGALGRRADLGFARPNLATLASTLAALTLC
jgi:hypothetical protein